MFISRINLGTCNNAGLRQNNPSINVSNQQHIQTNFLGKEVTLLNGFKTDSDLVKKVMDSVIKLRRSKSSELEKPLAAMQLEDACTDSKFEFKCQEVIDALANENLIEKLHNGAVKVPEHVKQIFLAGGKGTGCCRRYIDPVTGEALENIPVFNFKNKS